MKKIITGLLCLSFLFAATACGGEIVESDSKVSMIKSNAGQYVMDNGKIQVVIERATGSVTAVKNLTTGIVHKDPQKGAWPFKLEVSNDNSDECSITPGGRNRVSRTRFYNREGRDYIEMTYRDLITDYSEKSTGISAVTYLSIAAGEEYFKLSADFDLTSAPAGIGMLSFCDGGALRGVAEEDAETERMTAPTWGGGVYWETPADNKYFNNGVSLGYPGVDMQSLECGWMDVHGEDSGIGIAVVNRQELYTEFKVASEGQTGMSISPTLFAPTLLGISEIALEPGVVFSSDEVIVAPHTGDWHAMADIYRGEYAKAFVTEDGKPDYITEETLSPKVKEYDYIIRGIAGMDGKLDSTFPQMLEDFNAFVSETNADPANGVMWLAGQNPQGYAFDVPFMTPTYEPSGGDEGLKKLIEDLHAQGADMYVYEHPFAVDPNHPKIAGILDAVCPGGKDDPQHTETWNLCTHYSVCTYNSTMYNLWKEEILPPIAALGVDGLQFDQSSLQQTVCDRPGHEHGLDAVSRLSAHTKGNVRLSKLARTAMSGNSGYLMAESYNDLTARYSDCASNAWFNASTLLFGADGFEYGCTQYTHPYIRYQPSSVVAFSATNKPTVGVLIGAVTGGVVCAAEATSAVARTSYVTMKKELRAASAPGYPFGYKDTLGLKLSDDSVFARVFTDGGKITLTYTTLVGSNASKATLDLDKLGFAGKGTIEVDLPEIAYNTAGFLIIDPNA